MRKILVLALAILSGHFCFAQSYGTLDNPDVGDVSKSNAFFVGPKMGGSLSFISGQPKECDLFDGGSFGFSGGIAMKARFGRATENSYEGTGMLGVGLELKYRQAKAKTIGNDDLSLGYFEIPLMIQFYPKVNSNIMNGLYIEAGPDFAILLSKSPDILNANEFVKYHTGDLKGRDCRIALGVGYTLPNSGLDINARYYIGMSELAENSLPTKMSFLEISLSWMFKAAKF